MGGILILGMIIYKIFEQRFEIKARDPVTTGWDEIDKLCKGGIGKGELGVVIAPTGAGKSMVLVHLGTQAVLAGKTVVHYTLELQDTSIGIRYDSCLTGVSLSETHSFKEMIYEKVQELEGRLIIKEYPTKSASTQTIKNHLEKLRQKDIKVDMIIVDYGDLLKPVTATREKRHDLESIYEELRAIAQEQNAHYGLHHKPTDPVLMQRLLQWRRFPRLIVNVLSRISFFLYLEQLTTKIIIRGVYS